MNNVGFQIEEGVSNGASAYANPSKRNIGLLGQFVRGAGFSPTKITSLEDFNVIFGGQDSNFYGPAIVRSIFLEAGDAGVTLFISRVVNSEFVASTKTITLTGTETMKVTAAYHGVEDPGTWGNSVKATLYSCGYLVKDMFTLKVEYKNSTETYSYATLAEIQAAINKVGKYCMIEFSNEIDKLTLAAIIGTVTTTTNSRIVTGSDTTFTTLAVGNVLYDANSKIIGTIASIDSATQITLTSNAFVAVTAGAIKSRTDSSYEVVLTGGTDGTIVEADFHAGTDANGKKLGFSSFEGYDVQIIAYTELHSLSLAKSFNSWLNSVQCPVGIVNLPINSDEGTAELWAMELQTSGVSYLCSYLGWCKVTNDDGSSIVIPAIGSVIGAAWLRTPHLQGDYIHIPPGGEDSVFNYVTDFYPQRMSQSTINKCVQQFSCNVIRFADTLGYYVGSSRSYSTKSLYHSIHIRLQTAFYKRVLEEKLRFMEQKPNTPELKSSALQKLRSYFKNEYANGALERNVSFDKAYQGICDKSNNPSSQDRKLINITILWIPTECTESVRVSLQRNDGVLTITEE